MTLPEEIMLALWSEPEMVGEPRGGTGGLSSKEQERRDLCLRYWWREDTGNISWQEPQFSLSIRGSHWPGKIGLRKLIYFKIIYLLAFVYRNGWAPWGWVVWCWVCHGEEGPWWEVWTGGKPRLDWVAPSGVWPLQTSAVWPLMVRSTPGDQCSQVIVIGTSQPHTDIETNNYNLHSSKKYVSQILNS